jgi:hypothetical protein
MADQSMTKSLGAIRNLKIDIHGIPYVATFIVLQNNVLDSSYSMLLGRPWLKDAKVTHDQGNNLIIVQGNGTVKIISINKKLKAKTKTPQILVCYDLMEGLTNEDEDMMFETKPKLFLINTIIISNETISLPSVGVTNIKINGKFKPKQGISYQGATKVMALKKNNIIEC